jgi:hypothetical protein
MFQGGRKGQGKGVGASFQLELENPGSCSFLQVGACKLRGWCWKILEVVAVNIMVASGGMNLYCDL